MTTKKAMESTQLNEQEAVAHRVNKVDSSLAAKSQFHPSKTARETWVSKALRVARRVALSTLVLSSLNAVAYAESMPISQPIALASAQFDRDLIKQVRHQPKDVSGVPRPYKNKTLVIGLILTLEENAIREAGRKFIAGEISLQESRRLKKQAEDAAKAQIDELNIRAYGKVVRDNSAEARRERLERGRIKDRRSLPETIYHWVVDSVMDSLRSFVAPNDAKEKSASLSPASALNLARGNASSVEQILSQSQIKESPFSNKPNVAMLEEMPSIIKEVLDLSPPSFSISMLTAHPEDIRESLIAQFESLMLFNDAAGAQFEGRADDVINGLNQLKHIRDLEGAASDANALKGQLTNLLDLGGSRSAVLDLATSTLEKRANHLSNKDNINEMLSEMVAYIESDDLQGIDELLPNLSEYLGIEEVRALKLYSNQIADQESHAFLSTPTSLTMN